MRRMTLVVFEVLERAWSSRDCALIDMKIEFGVNQQGRTFYLLKNTTFLQTSHFSNKIYNTVNPDQKDPEPRLSGFSLRKDLL